MRPLFFLSLLLVLFTNPVLGQFGAPSAGDSKSALVADVTSVAPGETFTVALTLDHPIGWHSYYINPGTIGLPVTMNWTLPEGVTAGDVQFPIPHKTKVDGADGKVTIYGYEGSNSFLATLSVAEGVAVGTVLNFEVNTNWLICDEKGCRPERASFEFSVAVSEKIEANAEGKDIVEQAQTHRPKSGKDLAIQVTEADDIITIEAELPADIEKPKDAYFYSADRQVDAQIKQKAKFSDGKLVLTTSRNNGNEANFVDAGERLPTLSGILVVETADGEVGFEIERKINGGDDDSEGEAALVVPKVETPIEPTEIVDTEHEIPAVEAASVDWTEEEIAKGTELYDPDDRPKFVLLNGEEEKALTLLPALGLVFIGGLLLNLMPCVFPVLGLKIMGFVQQAGEDERKVKKHGMVFGLGVLVSMWILSGIIIATGLNWGAQLTEPAFVAGIIILMFLMGLNLAGVFEFGTSATSVGGNLQMKKGYSGSFFSGVLTTLIATPCSGPFLGTVMGFALSQKAPTALLIFTVFAFGIASPYIVMSFFPALINKLPRPGAWMEHFKKGMSFALFATAAFFLHTFANQTGYGGISWLLFALVVIALAAWIYGTWGTLFQSKKIRFGVGYGLTILVALLGFQMTRIAVAKEAPILAGGDEWKKWFPGAMEVTRSKKRIAWIDYTANW